MSRRKLSIPKGGKPLPPTTRLKQLPAASRQRIYELLEKLSYEEAAKQVELDFGIRCSEDSLRSFRSWQFQENRMENYNGLIEQFEQFYTRANPNATRDKVRDAGIAFFLAETTANNDRKGFSDVANLDLRDREGQTKAKLDGKKIELSERKVRLLEAKAKQADDAKAVIESKLSPEEQRRRLKEILK